MSLPFVSQSVITPHVPRLQRGLCRPRLDLQPSQAGGAPGLLQGKAYVTAPKMGEIYEGTHTTIKTITLGPCNYSSHLGTRSRGSGLRLLLGVWQALPCEESLEGLEDAGCQTWFIRHQAFTQASCRLARNLFLKIHQALPKAWNVLRSPPWPRAKAPVTSRVWLLASKERQT